MISERKPNHLAHEKSPYLLQHAFNPVDWFPWSEEAFEKARQEDKPVFLSIGYSTCHWCHVMEKESFEDPEVADLLNSTFVCIKVDREERPDLDAMYMKVVQTITGTGGWPLHVIMTSDKKPFFAATYMPKKQSFGQAGIMEITKQIKKLWLNKRTELLASAQNIADVFSQENLTVQAPLPSEQLGEHTLHEAYLQLSDNFDEQNGGFGHAPKFPSPQNLTFLLRYWKRTAYGKALEMVEKTLRSMRQGGIYDQLGFGFHRYSTDSQWQVPHFEKMLYDQAMLLIAYAEVYQATRIEEFAKTAFEIITYVSEELTDTSGGFFSAEDADTEGEEGKYYLWTKAQINEVLTGEMARLAIKTFNINGNGNYGKASNTHTNGKNVLFLKNTLPEISDELKIPLPDLQQQVEEARKNLLAKRLTRVHPNKDDKILTDWNGLMIAAFAISARVFDKPEFATASKKAVEFISETMIDSLGRLFHRFRNGEAAIPGFLDDYAFFIWGLIELYETLFDAEYLKSAIELTEKMIEYFWDEEKGGFFQTANYSEVVLTRNKDATDSAYPSGNSVAALNLVRLAHLTGEARFEERAKQLLQTFSTKIAENPSNYSQMMTALDFALGPSTEIVITGDPKNPVTREMLRALESRFIPRKVVLLITSGKNSTTRDLAKFSQYLLIKGTQTTAYVCKGHVCNPPTTDAKTMLEQIES